MRTTIKLDPVFLLMFLALVACGPSQADLDAETTKIAADTYATQTAEATANTPLPTSTPTHTPTAEPTAVPTAELTFGDFEDIEHGGFRYKMVEDFYRTYQPGAVTMSSDVHEILITLGGSPVQEGMTIKEAVEDWITYMSGEMADFEHSDIFPYKMVGLDGYGVNYEGVLFGDHMNGLIALVYHDGDTVFEVVAAAPDERWKSGAEDVINQILQTVELYAPTPMENYCPISSDPTYGYSQDNPIGVGTGDIFEGPSLEREYLDQLLGPRGEELE